MPIRNDRLANDYRSLQKLCVFHEPEKIKILEKGGDPPNFYRLQISNCKGIEEVVDGLVQYKNEQVVNGLVQYRTEHILIVRDFPFNYPDPGSLPIFSMETPLFHPHVYSNGIISFFLGLDSFQRLDNLVKKVLDLIQYKDDWTSGCPCNQAARKWAVKNKHLFPLKDKPLIV